MNKLFLSLSVLLLGFVSAALAQTPAPAAPKHKVVLQMNVENPDSWNQLLGNIQNIQKVFGAETMAIEVVVYGKGMNLIVKTNTAFEERLKKASSTGVVFSACQNSMRMRKLTTEDLFPFASQVDSGVAEIIRKQEAGWSYVKVGE